MLNISTITKALETLLQADETITNNEFRIERSDYINMDPERAPWVGIYKGKQHCVPHSMGRNTKSWKCTVVMSLYIQAAHLDSGADCEDRLDYYIQLIKDAVWADPTIGGTVAQVVDIECEYTYEKPNESETMFFQMAILNITAEAFTG